MTGLVRSSRACGVDRLSRFDRFDLMNHRINPAAMQRLLRNRAMRSGDGRIDRQQRSVRNCCGANELAKSIHQARFDVNRVGVAGQMKINHGHEGKERLLHRKRRGA
jgi:hypothetical protein